MGGDADQDFVHFCPIHAAGAFGDGGALRGFVELRGQGAGDELIHADLLARGEFAGLGRNPVRDVNLNLHDVGIIAAKSRGGKTSMFNNRAGSR